MDAEMSSMSDEFARLLEEFDDMGIEMEVHFRMLDRQLRMVADGIMADEAKYEETRVALEAANSAPPEGSAARPVGESDPLTIKEIICLPELGGYLAVDPAFNRPSKTFTKKVLEGYIAKGLPIVQGRKGETIRIKPKSLREFFSECQDQPSRPISSGSDRGVTKKQGNWSGKDSGQSSTERSSLARDSALSMLTKLRNGT